MDILHLPPNVLTKIFTYLTQKELIVSVRETCKLWHDLSYERSLWKQFDVRTYSDCSVTTKSFFAVLASISDFVECLHIDIDLLGIQAVLHDPVTCSCLKELYIYCSVGNQLEDNDNYNATEIVQLIECLPVLAEKYPQLKSLHILGKIGLGEDLSLLENCFPLLEEIELEDCPESGFLEAFFECHEKLQSVTIRDSVIGRKALSAILTKTLNLKYLDLYNTSTDVYDFSLDEVKSEKLKLVSLQSLYLEKAPCNDQEFSAIVKSAPNLEYLSVIGCQKLTDCGIDSLAENCQNLKALLINEQPYTKCNVTNAALQRVGENCKKLRIILANFCSEINNVGVEAIATNCPHLTELSIRGCTALTDGAVLTIVENCPLVKKLDFGHCVQLTSKCVNALFTKCPNLYYLNLETCHRLTDISIGKQNSELHLSNTKNSMDFQCCDDVNTTECSELNVGATTENNNNSENLILKCDELKLHLLENHCHIRRLNLAFCSKISNNCLKQIAAQCPDLLLLDIQGCSMVTNAGVCYLTDGCILLKSLIISGGSVSKTSRLTDGCLSHISKVCTNLEELMIVKNHNITSNGIFEVISKCPKIAKVKVTVSKRSNIKPESLTSLAGSVEGKILCIKYVGDVEILIAKDPDYSL